MPLPKPANDEDRQGFLSRCMGEIAEEFEDNAQRYAVCVGLWEDRENKNVNEQLLKAIQARTNRKAEFGYGITTADQYVRKAVDEIGEDIATRFAVRTGSVASLLKDAENRLVYANPDMVVEKRTTNPSDFSDLLPKGVKVPNNTLMVLHHVVTSPREDRDKDILRTEGGELDPKAPLLWQHMHTMPLGKVLVELEHTKDVLKVASVLLDLNDLTADAAKLIEADVLRFSHGFRVLEFIERKANKDEDGPLGFDIKRFEIMEVSLVSVPSNVDAEIELFSRGKLASDFFRAHAKHYLRERPVQSPGVEITTLKLGGAEAAVKVLTVKEMKSDEVGIIDDLGQTSIEPETNSQDKGCLTTDLKEEIHEDPLETTESELVPTNNVVVEEKEEKRGRVLSARNLDSLQETLGDLEELANSELTRSQKALLDRCITRLQKVVEAATPQEPEEEEEDKTINAVTFTVEDAMRLVILEANKQQLARLKSVLSACQEAADRDEKARQFRRIVSS